MIAALVVFVLAALLVAWLCSKLSKAHLTASMHCETIALMLTDQDHAVEIAETRRRLMQKEGLWKS